MMTRGHWYGVACVLAVFAAAAPGRAEAAWQTAGVVTSCTTGSGQAECVLSSGGRLLGDFYADDLVRVRISPNGVFEERPTGALVASPRQPHQAQIYDTPGAVFMVSPKMIVGLFKDPLLIAIWRGDGTLISVTREQGIGWDAATGVVFAQHLSLPGEHYLGLGERGGPLDRRGRTITMKNTDGAAFSSLTDPMYISIPFFYTFRDGLAAGVYVDSGATPYFELDKNNSGTLGFGVLSGDLDYYVMAGPEPISVAKGFRQLTGPNQMPPLWSLGYHQSRYSYMTQTEALETAWLLRAHQIPSDVLYFDIDYLYGLNMFSWNNHAFPDPAGMNTWLKSWGFHSVNIMEPMNHIGDPLFPWLTQQGFYLTGPGGAPLVNDIWFGRVSWLDMSKTAVRDWYKTTLKGFLGTYNIDGVWNDLNEPAQNYMPEAVYDFDGEPRTDIEARNLYALLEGRASYEAQRELRPNVRPWIFSRSGFAGLHRYAANWGGDADTSWPSLRANVEMTLSMGLSGQPFFGHDIGGFLGSPSPELFMRWLTFSAYTPLFRNHAMNTSARREPWAFDEPYLSMIRNVIDERYRLLPYIYSLFQHDGLHAEPVVAPLPFHFPADETTYVIDDEFMLGPSLLVAPILTEGIPLRWVYLPAGANWIQQGTTTVHEGGNWISVTAAVDQIPVFVREGAIIPKAPVAQSTSVQPRDRRSLDVYCGQAASFNLYEDDGTSFDYEQGQYLLTRLSCTPGSQVTVGIERVFGTWTPAPARQWWIHLHRTAARPSAVRRGGVTLTYAQAEADLETVSEGWTYTADQRVVVKVADQAALLQVTVLP